MGSPSSHLSRCNIPLIFPALIRLQDPASRFRAFFDELFGSYINIALLLFCAFLLFKILRKSIFDSAEEPPRPPPNPPMKKRDLTLDELKQFDGKAGGEK